MSFLIFWSKFCPQVIREAIDVFQKKNDTFRLASRELTVAEPVSCINSRNME